VTAKRGTAENDTMKEKKKWETFPKKKEQESRRVSKEVPVEGSEIQGMIKGRTRGSRGIGAIGGSA